MKIDAKGIHYKDLNNIIHQAIDQGAGDIFLENVNGQRYIGGGLNGNGVRITINGVPGNDLAGFMDGTTLVVSSNAQDGVGNTMNSGRIVIHGDAGDIIGYAMRGGEIYVKGDVGYRVGIHMKSYKDLYPVIVIGGNAGDFLGEYMAGGLIILLGKAGNYIGTGMHGGTIYIKGDVKDFQLGKEVGMNSLDECDNLLLKKYITEYCNCFNLEPARILSSGFKKFSAHSTRPYGRLYTY